MLINRNFIKQYVISILKTYQNCLRRLNLARQNGLRNFPISKSRILALITLVVDEGPKIWRALWEIREAIFREDLGRIGGRPSAFLTQQEGIYEVLAQLGFDFVEMEQKLR